MILPAKIFDLAPCLGSRLIRGTNSPCGEKIGEAIKVHQRYVAELELHNQADHQRADESATLRFWSIAGLHSSVKALVGRNEEFLGVDSGYGMRLELMEDWYRQLVRLDEREQLLIHDYAPHRDFLGDLRGSVLDIGGGAGIAARFLHPGVSYVVVDPSEVWDAPEWIDFSKDFRGSGPEPTFIRASGEDLPFPAKQFDVALSFWSLNHAVDPARCISEMARVVKSGGVARLVVDDVEPNWGELLIDGVRRVWARLTGVRYDALIKTRLISAFKMKLRGRWTIHDDHIPIAHRDLLTWLPEEMQVQRRHWLDGSLTYDLVKH